MGTWVWMDGGAWAPCFVKARVLMVLRSFLRECCVGRWGGWRQPRPSECQTSGHACTMRAVRLAPSPLTARPNPSPEQIFGGNSPELPLRILEGFARAVRGYRAWAGPTQPLPPGVVGGTMRGARRRIVFFGAHLSVEF